ncbi:MAG TPA: hypothetical protein VMT16_10965 [Thermoanaerobaculia bacterium]|nr:hypothetical protein [Thermoanaerobaculia bacterium]
MRRGGSARPAAASRASGGPSWPLQLTRNLLLWLPPVALVWLLVTPYYNLFLTHAAENLVRLTERPDVTRLQTHDRHHLVITRTGARVPGLPYSVRTTDVHFHLVLLGALFLAVPSVPWRQRLANLGWALLATVFFHLLDLLFWVKFVYATQLGAWSAARYGAFGQNFWGLGKHLLDLPVKLALPLALWGVAYLGELRRR